MNIEDAHEKFRNRWGTHTDYSYQPLTKKRDVGLNNLLDNLFVRYFKKIMSSIRKNKKNISNDSSPYFMSKPAKIYEKDIIGYFKIQ